MAKLSKSISEQITILQDRDLQFRNISNASHILNNISYYRLKGYWWELQDNNENHHFAPNSYFEDVIDLYNFDRHFRMILFNAIERIEISLRTKMIYHLSLGYGAHWSKNNQARFHYIFHMLNHSTYHRGQIVSIARQLGVTEGIPGTDYNAFTRK